MGNKEKTGRYLYCIAARPPKSQQRQSEYQKINFGKIGIEKEQVYTILYKDLCLVVHDSPLEPYKSEDESKIKKWVIAHQNVIEKVQKKFGTVLPLGFDTIIKGDEKAAPEANIEAWLKKDYSSLKETIAKVKGKREYGIQIFWDPQIISQKLIKEND
ncbi:GvpL/GvpF family gas vesicle protein, partial [Patescibacteria group bacterium AH-259-L05]|nr:GvpL/GvpF family gas vesicle protein [Patescibacteria group bacterium AH-259-L05]